MSWSLIISASVYLIFESRMALTTTFEEMDYITPTYIHTGG